MREGEKVYIRYISCYCLLLNVDQYNMHSNVKCQMSTTPIKFNNNENKCQRVVVVGLQHRPQTGGRSQCKF